MSTAPGFPKPLIAGWLLLVGFLLTTWLPHYLNWPLWTDHDDFAMLARAWGQGKYPYRDLPCFNLPGQIYLFAILGEAFGWGRSLPLQAFDASLVVGYGIALIAWSRKRFGTIGPGLIGYLGFLGYQLNLGYHITAQRDWHAAFLAMLGLLALDAWPGRGSRVFSALALTAGFLFRPQVVLFGPAYLVAMQAGCGGKDWRGTFRLWLEWGIVAAIGLALDFAPLARDGLLGDFVREFGRVLRPGHVNGVKVGSLGSALIYQIYQWKWIFVFLATASLGRSVSPACWVATAFVFLYKPLSPGIYEYLEIPLVLVWSWHLAWLGSALREMPRPVIAGLILTILAVPEKPLYCSPRASLDAMKWLAAGADRAEPLPATIPPGYVPRGYYPWEDYRALLNHLRKTTSPTTRIANALVGLPTAVVSAVDRPSLFPTATLSWIRVAPDAAEEYARRLAESKDAVVVWAPEENAWIGSPTYRLGYSSTRDESLKPPRVIEDAIRRNYRREAKFGVLEVWRR